MEEDPRGWNSVPKDGIRPRVVSPYFYSLYLLVSLVLIFLVSGCGGQGFTVPAPQGSCQIAQPRFGYPSTNNGKYIVKTKAVVSAFAAPEPEALKDAEKLADHYYSVTQPQDQDASDFLQELQSSPEVEFVEPDPRVTHFFQPNDPRYSAQWAHEVVRSAQAWDISQGSHEVIVAIIDSGIDLNHIDLAGNLWTNPNETLNGQDDDDNGLIDDLYGWDFANNDNDPTADDFPNYHGTHVSGTIGAIGNNGVGGIGHAPVVKLMPLKFLSSTGQGDTSNAIKAIRYAVSKGAKIINNSWGGTGYSQALSNAIEEARAAGVLFVAAAGNGGNDGIGDNNDHSPVYPASYPHDNVLTVAATDGVDALTQFSNFGLTSVDIAAPGLQILSTRNGDSYQNMSGTSMATPLVSGVAATMFAYDSNLTYSQVKNVLLSTVAKTAQLQFSVLSGGRISAVRALATLTNGAVPVPEPRPGTGGGIPDLTTRCP